MPQATPDLVIAHVDLLLAVDRLLQQAQSVRAKREALGQLLSGQTDGCAGTREEPTGAEAAHA